MNRYDHLSIRWTVAAIQIAEKKVRAHRFDAGHACSKSDLYNHAVLGGESQFVAGIGRAIFSNSSNLFVTPAQKRSALAS